MIERNLKDNMKKQDVILFGRKFWIQLDIVEKILMKKTGLNKSQFFLSEQLNLSQKDLEELDKLFKKIAFGYPIEYALENAEFYWLNFYVDKRCLIPRNDTEIMVDKAIEIVHEFSLKNNNIVYIDVWTGSWAIPISIVDNIWQYIDKVFAVDISEEALEVAKKNIKLYNLVDKIKLLKSDLLSIFELDTNVFDKSWNINIEKLVITANLPYIKNKDFWNMDKEVILHEPSVALYWWKKTGFELYEKLIFECFELHSIYNIINLILFIEIWFDQKEYAINYLNNKKLNFEIFKDNWGVNRCIKINF